MKKIIRKSIPEELAYLAEIINNAGYKFYIVGGFVRDIFLASCDTYENDIDVCGDCPPDIFSGLIADSDKIKLCEANYPLGTLKLIVGKLDIEYTCFRTESYRGDGFHTPSQISFTKDMHSDALRRDFTINALYLNPLTYEITDYFNGQGDIANKIIKTVRQSTQVFTEDALRILRMCRFAAKLGFYIDGDTLAGAKSCAHLLKNISKERIGAELDKIICNTEYLEYGINAIYKSNINNFICKSVKEDTANLVLSSKKIRSVCWAVFLSDNSPKEAEMYLLDLSLGKSLAKEVSSLIANKNLADNSLETIVLHFAKTGQKAAVNQITFIKTFSNKDAEYLVTIYDSMKNNGQFISYTMLNIDGYDIINLLDVSGKDVKVYKDMAYNYAVLNPDKNTFKDLKTFLLNIKK